MENYDNKNDASNMYKKVKEITGTQRQIGVLKDKAGKGYYRYKR